tara:strand:+ start:665 stop:1051 length:387 start_codon:yes stop_codon:yes gene_type:complete
MKSFIAIVGVSGGRVTKYADFDTLVEADAHAVKFGGFTHETLDGPIGYWVVNNNSITLDTDQEAADILAAKWARIRAQRDALLASSDWRAMPDAPTMSDAWTNYRQALRNLPSTQADPDNVVFPEEPS